MGRRALKSKFGIRFTAIRTGKIEAIIRRGWFAAF
jgi:hypothetical protein